MAIAAARAGRLVALAATAVFGLWPQCASASNPAKPHPHQGILPRLPVDGPLDISLSPEDLATVEEGGLWTKAWEVNGFGRGVGVQDIAAPMEVIFGQISDLKGYVGKAPKLKSLDVYSSERLQKEAGGDPEVVEKAAYRINVLPGYEFEYFVEHHASQSSGSLMFHLDYSRRSDVEDMLGKWHLQEHPTRPGWTRLHYQLDLKPFGYVPSILKSFASRRGILTTIGWVKFHSERQAKRTLPQLLWVPAPALLVAALAPCAGSCRAPRDALPPSMEAGGSRGAIGAQDTSASLRLALATGLIGAALGTSLRAGGRRHGRASRAGR